MLLDKGIFLSLFAADYIIIVETISIADDKISITIVWGCLHCAIWNAALYKAKRALDGILVCLTKLENCFFLFFQVVLPNN